MAEVIPTRIVVNGEEMTIDAATRLTVMVHQQGIRVDVPEFVEINGRNTLDCMEKMSQRAWEHISTGELFQHLFRMVFPPEDGDVAIPATIEQLNRGDFGVTHIAGMIVLGCEAMFEGKYKIFLRTPEDHLHPKAERRVMAMVLRMGELLAPGEDVQVQTQTAVAPDPVEPAEPAIEPEKPKKAKKKTPRKKKE